jgi:hypothetical protein
LSFTGLEEAFERNRGALEATVRSLVLNEGAPSAEGAPAPARSMPANVV